MGNFGAKTTKLVTKMAKLSKSIKLTLATLKPDHYKIKDFTDIYEISVLWLVLACLPDALLSTFQKNITLTNMFDKNSTIGFKLKDEIDLKTFFTN